MANLLERIAKRHDMMMDMPSGTPWLDSPVVLQESRAHSCKLTPEQCSYQSYFYRNWYEADYAYGLGSVWFFVAVIVFFTALRLLAKTKPASATERGPWQKAVAFSRYLAYRSYVLRPLAWYSPSLGVLVLGALGTIFYFAFTLGPKPYYWPSLPDGQSYGDSNPIATRSGWLALGIFPFLVIVPAKLNLITQLTGVSHERLQVFHRWMAYAMFVLGLVHTFPFIVKSIEEGEMVMNWDTNFDYWTGVVALLAQAYLTFFSFKLLRDRFYEFFKATHYLAIIVFVVFFFIHCGGVLTSWLFFIAAGVAYFLPLFASMLRTYMEYGFGLKAYITQEANNTVTVRVPVRSWWKPGQHVFLRFVSPKLGMHCLAAHPFTLCSLPESGEAVFHIRIRGGITKRLASVAQKYPNVPIAVMFDGPYGGVQETDLLSFDQQLVIAGGSGAGFTMPLVEKAIKQHWRPAIDEQEKTSLLQKPLGSKMHVVIVTRQPETERWYRREITHMLERYGPGLESNPLQVHLHVTENVSQVSSNANSTSEVEQVAIKTLKDDKGVEDLFGMGKGEQVDACTTCGGRPDLPALIKEMTTSLGGKSLGIAVCGPSSMMYDVRNAAAEAELRALRGEKGATSVYLHTESFGW